MAARPQNVRFWEASVPAGHRPTSAPNGGYLERSGNRCWSGGIFAAGTCCRGGFGKVAVVVVWLLAGGVLGALEAELVLTA